MLKKPVSPPLFEGCWLCRLGLGQGVPGELRERCLSKLPTRQCQYVAVATQTGADARTFHRAWEPTLSLFRNDCRHHTQALVQHLTVRWYPNPVIKGRGCVRRRR